MSRNTFGLPVLTNLLAMLVGVAVNSPALATTLSGTQTSSTNVADQVIMNSVNTNGFTITTTVGNSPSPAIGVNGSNTIDADITTTAPGGFSNFLFVDTYSVTQSAGTLTAGVFSGFQFQQGSYIMNGGTIRVGTWFNIGSRGNNVFTLNNGTIQGNGATQNFGGPGGAAGIDVGGREQVAPTALGKATMNINGGTITAANMGVGRAAFGGGLAGDHIQGIVIQNGGSVTLNSTLGYNNSAADGNSALVISRPNNITTVTPESSYSLFGGSLSIPNRNTKIYDTGRLQGWGTVSSSTRTLDNSGKVVADGVGVDHTLNLSSYGTIANSIENTGARGWYATSHGKLTLPSLNVSSGSSTLNWGEASEDAQIDLVNSARLGFNSIGTGGPVSISLVASDHSSVPTGLNGPALGIWDVVGTGSFALGGGNVDLTFRYDNAALTASGANISRLKLYHYTGGSWLDITSSVDPVNFTIIANGVSSFSMFAAAVPEPTGALLALAAPLAMLSRRRFGRGK